MVKDEKELPFTGYGANANVTGIGVQTDGEGAQTCLPLSKWGSHSSTPYDNIRDTGHISLPHV